MRITWWLHPGIHETERMQPEYHAYITPNTEEYDDRPDTGARARRFPLRNRLEPEPQLALQRSRSGSSR
jgi:hypothetical protein